MSDAVSFDRLNAGYEGRVVVRDFEVAVPAGRLTALLGANGCGKSTALAVVAGLLEPMSGGVSFGVGGVDGVKPARRDFLAMVAQGHALSFPFSVLDVVLTGRVRFISTFRTPAPSDVAASERALERMGIAHLSGRDYTTLSGGERQLVLLARALAQEPQILLLDEPTTYLDLHNQHRVLSVVRELCADGLTVLATLHDPNQALAYADRAIVMRRLDADDTRPSLISAGSPGGVINVDSLREAYGIEARFVGTDRGPAMLPWLD